MMDHNQKFVEEVQTFMVHIATLPVCDNKQKIMNALLDLEWNLRKENVTELPEEVHGGKECPWSD